MSRREFHFSEGTSNKFWAIQLVGRSYTIHFGRIGTEGQVQTKEFLSSEEAKKSHEKLLAEKLKKGYVEQQGGSKDQKKSAVKRGDASAKRKTAPLAHATGVETASESCATTDSLNDEQRFLAAIKAQPDLRATRLAYADWLEERGDLRGELIRIEEELRSMPIHSDRYWELKPRRTDLRKASKEPWLQAMQYGTDYEPVFRQVPDDWRGRWRLIREYADRWFGVPMGDIGGNLEEIKKVERKLKVALPPAFGEWFAFIRDLKQKKGFVRHIHECARLVEVQGDEQLWTDLKLDKDSVLFLDLSEPDLIYFVPTANLQQPDPAVNWFDKVYLNGGVIPHITTFAFQYLMEYWMHKKDPGGFLHRVAATKPLLRLLDEAFPVQSNFDGVRFFERQNIVARLGQIPFSGSSDLMLEVAVFKTISHQDIPSSLWKLSQRDDCDCRGVFCDD
jgi:uncharacterized protein (TIGR02996 family)